MKDAIGRERERERDAPLRPTVRMKPPPPTTSIPKALSFGVGLEAPLAVAVEVLTAYACIRILVAGSPPATVSLLAPRSHVCPLSRAVGRAIIRVGRAVKCTFVPTRTNAIGHSAATGRVVSPLFNAEIYPGGVAGTRSNNAPTIPVAATTSSISGLTPFCAFSVGMQVAWIAAAGCRASTAILARKTRRGAISPRIAAPRSITALTNAQVVAVVVHGF